MLAGFAEVEGLATETDIVEYREGNEDISVGRLLRIRKRANIILRRGFTKLHGTAHYAARPEPQARHRLGVPRGLALQLDQTSNQRREKRHRYRRDGACAGGGLSS